MILTIKRSDGSFLPRGTRVRIVSHPDGQRVFKVTTARTANIELDRGAYEYSIHKSTKGINGKFSQWREVHTIFHGMTQVEFESLQTRPRRHTKGTVTSEGTRWGCNYPGCEEAGMTSHVAALLHELEDHYGETPVEETEETIHGKCCPPKLEAAKSTVQTVMPTPSSDTAATAPLQYADEAVKVPAQAPPAPAATIPAAEPDTDRAIDGDEAAEFDPADVANAGGDKNEDEKPLDETQPRQRRQVRKPLKPPAGARTRNTGG